MAYVGLHPQRELCDLQRRHSLPGWAAVAAVADANGEVVISSPSDWFLIQDEPTAAQGGSATLNVDRLTVGHWMWVRSGSAGRINCNSGDCI